MRGRRHDDGGVPFAVNSAVPSGLCVWHPNPALKRRAIFRSPFGTLIFRSVRDVGFGRRFGTLVAPLRPKGPPTIARRFNAGWEPHGGEVPKGRQNIPTRGPSSSGAL